jgi:hypothetical protein
MLSREYVEATLQDGGYLAVFADAARGALQDWFAVIAVSPNLMASANHRERAAFLNRRIIEKICKALEVDQNAAINVVQQSTLVTINNEIPLRFKKLNGAMRAMNIKTRRVKKLWHKNMKPLPGAFENWINVTFGWQLGFTGAIKRLAVVFEFGDVLQWYIPVSGDDMQDAPLTQLPLLPQLGGSEQAGFVAIVRDTERARRIAENDKRDNTDTVT